LGPSQPESADDLDSARRHLALTYKILGAVCAIGHIRALFFILTSSSPLAAFQETFVPNFQLDYSDLIGLLHSFFLCDYLLCLLAFTIYAWATRPKNLSAATFVIGLVLLGPGYTMLASGEARDEQIHRAVEITLN
jgi:hypothetical protein